MDTLSTVFGWDQGTWTVVVSVLALVVAVGGVVVAIASHRTSTRAAKEAARSATAAERSASTAEESTGLQREAIEIEHSRERRERLDAVLERGPKWEAAEEGEAGYFTSDESRMRGGLRNVGLATAAVQRAYMDFDGRQALVRTRCDGPHGGGGWASRVQVPPQAVLQLDCDLGGINLQGQARPSLNVGYEQPETDTGLLGVTIELLRTGNTAGGKDAWRVGRVCGGLRR